MTYTVQYGDTLSRIAAHQLGDSRRWPEIARINSLRDPDRLWLGQSLFLPAAQPRPQVKSARIAAQPFLPPVSSGSPQSFEHRHPLMPGELFLFLFADEINPLRKKLVRKVAVPKATLTAAELDRIMHPDVHGFSPRDPSSNVSIGRHVGQNMTNSKYISTSELPQGSPRFQGDKYFIDAGRAEAAGVKLHDGKTIAKDLDRVLSKTKDPKTISDLQRIKELSATVDREVLAEGHIPASAIKGAAAMNMTRGLQVVQGVGVVISVYDIGKAGQRSYREKSIVPLASEGARQAGGWAGAWAGVELGGAAGALVGIETGPGALVSGAIGSIIFGTAGFFGADWAVRKMGGR